MGMFDWIASNTSGPGSYQAMEARRKIAAAMVAQQRKGFPKTLGEGLTAVGDAIGERRMLAELAQQEAAYQKQATTAAADAVPAEAKTPGALPPIITQPPARTSEAAPAEETPTVAENPPAADDPWPARSRAIGGIESGGEKDPYATLGAVIPKTGDRAYGKYQMMGANIPEWSQAALGTAMTPQQFLNNPKAQEDIFRHRFGQYADKYGEEGAARAWYGGERGMKNLAATDLHGRLNVGQYGQDYLRRLGGQPDPRERATSALMGQGSADEAGDARFRDVVGMSNGPTGAYSYAPTASRTGDVQTDAPNITGISPRVGAAAADTLQSAAKPPAPEVPPVNPTLPGPTAPISPMTAATAGSPPEAAGNRPIVVQDIKPMSAAPVPAPGVQTAQALPDVPRAPLTGLPQRPVPPPVAVEPPPARMPLPQDERMTDDEARGYRLRSQALALGDPNMKAQADGLIAYGATQRKQAYDAKIQDYRDQVQLRHQKQIADEAFTRGAPERELARQKSELELAKGKAFGGLSEETVLKPVTESAKAVQGIPGGQAAVRNALRVLPDMFTGASADVDLSLKKLMGSAGFPVDPRVPASEQFKAFIMPALAAARQAQSGGANISDNDMLLAAKAVAGDIKLEPASIRAILEQLERTNVKAAIWHQSKIAGAAGDDPQRQATLYRGWGLPMEEIVPPDAIKMLRDNPTPQMMDHFNRKYQTPGLGQRLIGGG